VEISSRNMKRSNRIFIIWRYKSITQSVYESMNAILLQWTY